jgi:hypothetical protein
MRNITSPVAYITSLPDHVFLQEPDNTNYNGIRQYLTFWYTDEKFRRDNYSSTDPDYWRSRWITRGWSAWVLFSYGPSGKLDDNPSDPYGFTEPQEVSYDPTNGTVSFGGIYRGGPGGNNAL